jgi:hypothetical protein
MAVRAGPAQLFEAFLGGLGGGGAAQRLVGPGGLIVIVFDELEEPAGSLLLASERDGCEQGIAEPRVVRLAKGGSQHLERIGGVGLGDGHGSEQPQEQHGGVIAHLLDGAHGIYADAKFARRRVR